MTKGSYDYQEWHRDGDAEVDRLAAQASLGWQKELRNLRLFGLTDGMSILEIGSGPGYITKRLCAANPKSSLTCIEQDPNIIAQARANLSGPSELSVRIHESSVMKMPLEAESIDFAYARAVFQHLPDPAGALREIYRVLKPGGVLVVYDIDDDMFGLIDPPVPAHGQLLQTFGQAQSMQGGNRRIGRSLWRLFEGAGLKKLDLEIVAIHSDQEGIAAFYPQIDPDRVAPLLKSGLVSEQEYSNLKLEHARFISSEKPYILMSCIMVCGTK